MQGVLCSTADKEADRKADKHSHALASMYSCNQLLHKDAASACAALVGDAHRTEMPTQTLMNSSPRWVRLCKGLQDLG